MKHTGKGVSLFAGGGTVSGRLYHETTKGRTPLDPEMLVPPIKSSSLEALAARDQMTRELSKSTGVSFMVDVDYSEIEKRVLGMLRPTVARVLEDMMQKRIDEEGCGPTIAALRQAGWRTNETAEGIQSPDTGEGTE